VIAMRGTETDPMSQAFWDGFNADGLGIGGKGFATRDFILRTNPLRTAKSQRYK